MSNASFVPRRLHERSAMVSLVSISSLNWTESKNFAFDAFATEQTIFNDRPSVYNTPPNLTNITDDNELVFRFQPGDRDALSTAIPMQVNMTLYHFGSSQYKFNIQPRKKDHRCLPSPQHRCLFTVHPSSYDEGWLSNRKAIAETVDDSDQPHKSYNNATALMFRTRQSSGWSKTTNGCPSKLLCRWRIQSRQGASCLTLGYWQNIWAEDSHQSSSPIDFVRDLSSMLLRQKWSFRNRSDMSNDENRYR